MTIEKVKEKVKIEKNVPIPPTSGVPARLPFAELAVGDSFFTTHKSAGHTCPYWSAKLGRKFARRLENGGVRIWRIK